MQTVTLTDKEAESFLQWRQYQEEFEYLLKQGVFLLCGGYATIHKTPEGKIGDVDIFKKKRRICQKN